MKKQWNIPTMEHLSAKMTALSPKRNGEVDSEYTDNNNNLWSSYS